MANSLLDFVMSLVRDPDAAARYAADPARALADAHLTDVTTADVQNLIPVVSESLSMAAPTHSLDALDLEPVSNVWTSGAATAAFDAFDDQVPSPVIVDAQAGTPVIVDDLDLGFDVLTGSDMIDQVGSLQIADPEIDDPASSGTAIADDWAQPLDLPDAGDQPSGFDLFD
ncbi:Rv0340 family protein [Mycolicibacterium sp. BiH015]|uniref:Rv0340 family IniB-related protein n=1 Tax=Mycolicibacterium sp. BiH015 TaxID=3018808 RepID=UPI0022E61D1B|nr:Rv0340 family IniB-related protein [Mycolicibacterium sp. BiH015]MDA2891491.1 Rv0340 family protein [Mycolicibacterium sp. BiH015]